jgi:hypothetical protein
MFTTYVYMGICEYCTHQFASCLSAVRKLVKLSSSPTVLVGIQYSESIQLVIEDQTFLRSCDLAPPQPHPLLSRQQVVSLFQSFCVSPVELTVVGGGEGWGGAKLFDAEKAWSSLKSFKSTLWVY